MGRHIFKKYFGCQPVKLLLWLLFCLDSFGNHWVKSSTDQLAFYAYFLSETAVWKEFQCTHFTRNQKQRTLKLTRVETSFPTSHQFARSYLVGMTLIRRWQALFIHSVLVRSLLPRVSIRGFCIFLLWELYWSLIVHRTTAMQTPRGQR